MSAPAEASLFPPPKRLLGVELPRGFAAAAPPKRLPGVDMGVAAGFAPKRDPPDGGAPPAWLFCPPPNSDPLCAPPAAAGF